MHYELSIDVESAAEEFIHQLLVGTYGCASKEQLDTLTSHMETEDSDSYHRLDQLFPNTIFYAVETTQLLLLTKDHIYLKNPLGKCMSKIQDLFEICLIQK